MRARSCLARGKRTVPPVTGTGAPVSAFFAAAIAPDFTESATSRASSDQLPHTASSLSPRRYTLTSTSFSEHVTGFAASQYAV